MVYLSGGTLSAAKAGTEDSQEMTPEAHLHRGVEENWAEGPQRH